MVFGQIEKHFGEVHKGKKPFICNVCDTEFIRMKYFKKHNLRIHSYHCQTCEKKFPKDVLLEKHNLMVHKEDKAFQCNLCNRQFDQKQYFLSHKSYDHKLECNSCDRKFVKIEHFRMHRSIIP